MLDLILDGAAVALARITPIVLGDEPLLGLRPCVGGLALWFEGELIPPPIEPPGVAH